MKRKTMIAIAACTTLFVTNSAARPCNEIHTTSAITQQENIYDVVEQMPAFPGGNAKLMNFIYENKKQQTDANGNKIKGSVVVAFVVETDGSISNVGVRYSTNHELDKEAIRVVNSMPLWIPGRNNGEKVRVRFSVPFNFR